MQKIISTSEKDTIALGEKLGEACRGGEVFALKGDLGAGKTCLSKGIARGLKVKAIVNSPTFNIMKIYSAKKGNIKNFCHIDAYRLDKTTRLENIGLDEYLAKQDSVCVIEWPENIFPDVEKQITQVIKLQLINENERLIKIY